MRRMTLHGTVRLAIVLAIGVVGAAAVSSTVIPTASAEETTTVSDADITFFYKNPSPERVARLIVSFNTLIQPDKPSTEPPIIGFLAAAFQRYPSDIDKMIPEGLSVTMQQVVATSLRLAGQDTKARAVADHLRASGSAVPDLARIPSSLDAVEMIGPSEFDLLWGASFASGDPRYCLKILDRFAAVANVDGNADDMVTIARTYGTGADRHWVVEKRGADKARELIIQSSALWALDSNSRQHEFVRVTVGKYIDAHPQDPASKALLSLALAYGHYDARKIISVTQTAPGKPAATVNVAYFAQVLDDLGRHAGMYPPHFEFADDRQRAARDVAAIAGLLDPLSQNFSNSPLLLMRLGMLHAIGHNLDVPGSAGKAVAAFSTLLKLTPDDPQANYQYGEFLAQTTRKGEGIPYLEKAKTLGVANADYWLGFSYQMAGNEAKALENLESYTKRVPSDQNAARVLDAVRNHRVEFKEGKPPF